MGYNKSGERVITVMKDQLLAKLKENRSKHREIFLKAIDLFREEAIVVFDQNLQAARDGKKFSVHLDLSRPKDHTKDYTRAIEMLEWSIEDKIEITDSDFRAYVQDDWGWRPTFLSNKYAASATRSMS